MEAQHGAVFQGAGGMGEVDDLGIKELGDLYGPGVEEHLPPFEG